MEISSFCMQTANQIVFDVFFVLIFNALYFRTILKDGSGERKKTDNILKKDYIDKCPVVYLQRHKF